MLQKAYKNYIAHTLSLLIENPSPIEGPGDGANWPHDNEATHNDDNDHFNPDQEEIKPPPENPRSN